MASSVSLVDIISQYKEDIAVGLRNETPQQAFTRGERMRTNFNIILDAIGTGGGGNVKQWLDVDNLITVAPKDTIVISGDYVISNTILVVEADSATYTVGSLFFDLKGTLYIGGNLLVKDSIINNQGHIHVAGGVILVGNSSIIGEGTLG